MLNLICKLESKFRSEQKIVEMDEKVTFSTQLEEDVGTVILINKLL
jgi:hypothetical protein